MATPEPKAIYEDKDLLVLDKPAGWLTHQPPRLPIRPAPVLTDWLLERYPELRGVGESPERPGLVHRLDRETSGLLVVAKNQISFNHLKKQFQNRTVEKVYLALVTGVIKDNSGLIDRPIGRSRRDPRRRLAGRGRTGKLRPAVTAYQVRERFHRYTLLEVRPRTGRTHQIRVHLQAVGHPIAGDHLYAPSQPHPAPLQRQALHASHLALTSLDGRRLQFGSPPPTDFAAALDNLRRA